MSERGGSAEQSWEAWWKEENAFLHQVGHFLEALLAAAEVCSLGVSVRRNCRQRILHLSRRTAETILAALHSARVLGGQLDHYGHGEVLDIRGKAFRKLGAQCCGAGRNCGAAGAAPRVHQVPSCAVLLCVRSEFHAAAGWRTDARALRIQDSRLRCRTHDICAAQRAILLQGEVL